MFRLAAVLLLTLLANLAHADELEDADHAWTAGKPWPAHWGHIYQPYKEAWNTIFMGFVHKIYDKDEAAGTWLKHIPYAMQKGASVEVCMMKHGLLETAGLCKPAVVDPSIIGTLQEDDVVVFFYPNHGTKLFSAGPGSDARTTMRVFQKIAPAGEKTCWIRELLLYQRPNTPECWQRVDMANVENLLTRDFGPRDGASVASNSSAYNASSALTAEADAKSVSTMNNPAEIMPGVDKKEPTGVTGSAALNKP